MTNVELTEDGKFNCPICGKTLWDGENPADDLACEHLKMAFSDAVGEFYFLVDGMERTQIEVMQAYGADDYDGNIEEILELAAKKNGCSIYAITTSGMACGPVSNTDYLFIKKEAKKTKGGKK